jgi:hypothetical protein
MERLLASGATRSRRTSISRSVRTATEPLVHCIRVSKTMAKSVGASATDGHGTILGANRNGGCRAYHGDSGRRQRFNVRTTAFVAEVINHAGIVGTGRVSDHQSGSSETDYHRRLGGFYSVVGQHPKRPFGAVMHWGHDPALEKHYVPTRSQRACSVLTFFAQDTGTHNLVYANADLSKASQGREVIAFCDHWKAASGTDPAMLIMDQKVTTQLDQRGIKFLTLRMRSPALINHIDALTGADYTTVTLDRPGRYNEPKVHQDTAIRLTDYPGTVRQLVVTGLGRDTPTVVITNDHDLSIKALIEHYPRRMTIEQRLAEIIQAFHADALSSAVNLNADLDIMLCVLAQALTAALRARLPAYASVTPDVLQRRFLETPGQITTSTTPSPSASTDAPTPPCSGKPTSHLVPVSRRIGPDWFDCCKCN